ncbi:MAG: winged helix-turn-helix domain-containing protein [Candidatus Methylomirabilales bacterium]
MLLRLFASQTRVDLLGFFLSAPEGRWYMREIARAVGRDISGIKRELDNLEKAGLLLSSKERHLRYYTVNPAFPFLTELETIFSKTRGVPQMIANELTGIPGIRVAFLFGEKGFPESGPMDLFILGAPNMPQLNAAIARIEGCLNRDINSLVFDKAEYQRRKEERDPFLLDVLKGEKRLLVGSEDEL